MSFLSPYALFGLSLLAIPVVVHLFRPRKVKRTPFSSLRWLHLSQHRISRHIKWHQVFLFFLRAAFLTLLVLALARPVFAPQDQEKEAERFIILDVSRSMNYRPAERLSPLEQGKQLASQLISQHRSGDRTAVLLTGSRTRVLSPLTRDAASCLPALAGIRAQATDTDLASALPIIRAMLAQRRPDTEIHLYFVTDNHQQSWDQGDIATFVREAKFPLHVHLVDVGVGSPQNAWVADARFVQASRSGRKLIRVQVACVGDAAQQRTLRMAGLAGMSEQTEAITIDPGQPTRVEFELPENYQPVDQMAHIALEPADNLPDDDQFYLNLGAKGGLGVLIVENEANLVETLRPAFHLRTAIEALSASNDPVDLASKTTATVTIRDIEKSDVIILADVAQLSEGVVTALDARVKGGAGLVVFLGPATKTSFYNTRLYDPLRPAEGLLPGPLKEVVAVDASRGDSKSLTRVRWLHPLLAHLFDPVIGDLAQTRIRGYCQFAAPLQQTDSTLAWIDETTPAIVERNTGAGKVLLFNTTANDEWSDLPRRKSYVPFIDRLLNYLSGGRNRTFEAGQPVTMALPDPKPDERVVVTGPNGIEIRPTMEARAGRTLLRLDSVDQAGIYRVERHGDPKRDFRFIVRVGRADSVLTAMDSATLVQWWSPAKLEIVSPASVTDRWASPGTWVAVWPWLIALACLMLLAEMYFVHWLCPRANPQTVPSIVHRRGILSPMTTKQS